MKRFLIEVDAQWQATLSSGAWSAARALRPCPGDPRFPLPPENDLPAPAEEHFALCNGDAQALADAYAAVSGGKSNAPLARFGRYLFDTLIGGTCWDTMLAQARAENEQEIELALQWHPDEQHLHRLNWELLRAPGGFLAAAQTAQLGVRPAITRLIAAGANVRAPRPVHAPPRVLFVVGTELTDPRIKPGAELMGLLQHARRADLDRALHTRILLEASPERLQDAVREFQPDVVHFTCHGNVDRGEPFLELRPNKGDTEFTTEGDGRPTKRVFSHNLLEWLAAGGDTPPIVVLSACYSGAMLGPTQTAPLAAKLVRGGVPIVIGMAGSVADRACRLFARGFGESLLGGEPLVAAAARGRRAAAYDAARPPEKSGDWMMPTVFLSDKVPANYSPFADQPVVDQANTVRARIKTYGLESEPVFCGRAEFFEAYYPLVSAGARPVLMAYTLNREEGLGRRRLLNELAIQALLDGHVPVLINPAQSGWGAPTDPVQFAKELYRGVATAYKVFGIAPRSKQLLLLGTRSVEELKTVPELSDALRDEVMLENAVTALAVKFAAEADLKALAAEARAAGKATGRAIVFLNQLHRYGDALLNALLNQWLGDFGFGTAEEPVPAIVAFSLGDVADMVLKPFAEGKSAKPWVRALPLGPFRDDGEDLQAYHRVLFHSPPPLEGETPVPLAVNERADDEVRKDVEGNFREFLAGKPINLLGVLMKAMAKTARQRNYLIVADDNRILAEEAKDR